MFDLSSLMNKGIALGAGMLGKKQPAAAAVTNNPDMLRAIGHRGAVAPFQASPVEAPINHAVLGTFGKEAGGAPLPSSMWPGGEGDGVDFKKLSGALLGAGAGGQDKNAAPAPAPLQPLLLGGSIDPSALQAWRQRYSALLTGQPIG